MSFGSGFGAFMSGASGGMALGKSIMEKKDAKASTTKAGDDGKSVGFGLGQKLISGTVGASKAAEGASSGPWAALSGMLGGLAEQPAPIDVNNPLGNGVSATATN